MKFEKTMEELENRYSNITDSLNLDIAINDRDKHNLSLLIEFKEILIDNIIEANKKNDEHYFYFHDIKFLAPKGECYLNQSWVHAWSIHMLRWAKLWEEI